jgi:hypothetical protein
VAYTLAVAGATHAAIVSSPSTDFRRKLVHRSLCMYLPSPHALCHDPVFSDGRYQVLSVAMARQSRSLAAPIVGFGGGVTRSGRTPSECAKLIDEVES